MSTSQGAQRLHVYPLEKDSVVHLCRLVTGYDFILICAIKYWYTAIIAYLYVLRI